MNRPPDHRRKRKAPPGKGGASKIDCNSSKIERLNISTLINFIKD